MRYFARRCRNERESSKKWNKPKWSKTLLSDKSFYHRIRSPDISDNKKHVPYNVILSNAIGHSLHSVTHRRRANSSLSRYLMQQSSDLDLNSLRSFKVKCHGANWQSMGGFLSSFYQPHSSCSLEIFDIKSIFYHEKWWKLIPLSVWRTWMFRIYTENNVWSHLLWLCVDGTFGEDRWKIETCRADSFVWLTGWFIHRQLIL